jgi:hypothetical protein
VETAAGSVTFAVFLPDFGSKNGMVVGLLGWHLFDAEETAVANAAKLYLSALNPETYSTFDRDHFVDTLNDWGWYGPDDEQPAWYGGASRADLNS